MLGVGRMLSRDLDIRDEFRRLTKIRHHDGMSLRFQGCEGSTSWSISSDNLIDYRKIIRHRSSLRSAMQKIAIEIVDELSVAYSGGGVIMCAAIRILWRLQKEIREII